VRPAVEAIGYLNLVVFHDAGGGRGRTVETAAKASRRFWVAAAFVLLGLVVLAGRSDRLGFRRAASGSSCGSRSLRFVVFPYLLALPLRGGLRDRRRGRVQVFLSAMTALLVLWTVALPRIPQPDEDKPGWFVLYIGRIRRALVDPVGDRRAKACSGRVADSPRFARRRMTLLRLRGRCAITAAIVIRGARRLAVLRGGLW
jgi:hypothetical protein